MIIRRAEASDFDAIWPLLRDVFRAGATYAVDPQISKDAARSYWMDQCAACFVAQSDTEILGTYYIKTNQPGGGAHICNCGYVVAAQAQGQGLATQMCDHSQVQAVALGYSAMQFNFVLSSNTGALRIWARAGFEIIGTIPDAFKHPTLGVVAAHILYKRLNT